MLKGLEHGLCGVERRPHASGHLQERHGHPEVQILQRLHGAAGAAHGDDVRGAPAQVDERREAAVAEVVDLLVHGRPARQVVVQHELDLRDVGQVACDGGDLAKVRDGQPGVVALVRHGSFFPFVARRRVPAHAPGHAAELVAGPHAVERELHGRAGAGCHLVGKAELDVRVAEDHARAVGVRQHRQNSDEKSQGEEECRRACEGLRLSQAPVAQLRHEHED
mmetsp:Transcript_46574/g.149595  ORF Transcript_46574/g.149595 Transcript_46574/m.149595 type:complete len:222 (+) Transcript_46574:628-1293(+)